MELVKQQRHYPWELHYLSYGKKVLLIDADPQGDLTTCLGYYNQNSLSNTLGTLMANYIADKEINPHESILKHSEGVDIIPSNLDLSAIELALGNTMSREFTLKNCISTFNPSKSSSSSFAL